MRCSTTGAEIVVTGSSRRSERVSGVVVYEVLGRVVKVSQIG